MGENDVDFFFDQMADDNGDDTYNIADARTYLVTRRSNMKANTVHFLKNGVTLCTCGLVVRFGVLCRHILAAFYLRGKEDGLVLIPLAVTHPRWIIKPGTNYRMFKYGAAVACSSDDWFTRPNETLWYEIARMADARNAPVVDDDDDVDKKTLPRPYVFNSFVGKYKHIVQSALDSNDEHYKEGVFSQINQMESVALGRECDSQPANQCLSPTYRASKGAPTKKRIPSAVEKPKGNVGKRKAKRVLAAITGL